MAIENIIVHEVRKEEGDSLSDVIPREEENEINDHAEMLSSQLTKLFRKTGLNTGRFIEPENDDDPVPHFVSLLQKYFDGQGFNDFVSFTDAASNEFGRKLEVSTSSRGGYLWFNHFTHSEENYLSVVLLRKKAGISISQHLTLDAIEQVDLDKLHMAARINLTRWLDGDSQKYIAFRVGKDAKDVTEYFSKFIGCEEYTRARVDTNNLVQVTKNYCSAHGFTPERTEEVKQALYDQCLYWINNDVTVTIENISATLDSTFQPEDVGLFIEIAQEEPFLLNNEVPIERAALRSLRRISGRNSQVSISFDSDLLNKTVLYNPANGRLTFISPPEKLIAQIQNDAIGGE